MYSKRFHTMLRKMGKKNIPDWMLIACVIYTFRNYPNCLLAIDLAEWKTKFIGD